MKSEEHHTILPTMCRKLVKNKRSLGNAILEFIEFREKRSNKIRFTVSIQKLIVHILEILTLKRFLH